ncbi:hypothetical protein PROFUN_00390 [Planoprotostelium fungivorum]|uniref:Major facilitator superfamily (MFS) profile domain-containing protein n=1 Tax=Planoprotostelium fungivorum TaxID=1890364 RepID=A0A2P6NYB9_9EUKA|nr:hypothetical protein PROFUN_00390 [Planoprotostelium fungivorum]
MKDYDSESAPLFGNGSHPITNSYETEVAPIIDEKDLEKHDVYWECMFVTLPIFSGYACLFALRHDVMVLLNITDNNSTEAYWFGVASSLVYLGNLIFRLGHNLVFAFATPRFRVLISMVSMIVAIGIIASMFLILGSAHSRLWMVFLAYGLGGLGIGTFESNLLASLVPIGKENKFWAILGIPIGVNLITIGGYALIGVGVPTGWIYFATFIALFVGLAAFLVRIFRRAGEAHAVDLLPYLKKLFAVRSKHELSDTLQLRSWAPPIVWPSIALMFDMFFVALLSPGGLIQNVHPSKSSMHFSAFGSDLPFRTYMICYSILFFLGDMSSRKIFYNAAFVFPPFFLILSVIGGEEKMLIWCADGIGIFLVTNVAEIVFFAGFMAAFANGSMYAQASRRIDLVVPKKQHLIALSFWLFIGDIGSVAGSLLMQSLSGLYTHYRG